MQGTLLTVGARPALADAENLKACNQETWPFFNQARGGCCKCCSPQDYRWHAGRTGHSAWDVTRMHASLMLCARRQMWVDL
jgi:hypothetical protein